MPVMGGQGLHVSSTLFRELLLGPVARMPPSTLALHVICDSFHSGSTQQTHHNH